MSFYGKPPANPDHIESWQTQLDALQQIFAATEPVTQKQGIASDTPTAINVSLFPTGRPGASLRSRKTGSSSSLRQLSSTEHGEALSDLERQQREFSTWCTESYSREEAAVDTRQPVKNFGAEREAAEIAALVEQQRLAALPAGDLPRPVTSHTEHVRRLAFGGDVVGTLSGHDGPVNCLATLHDGRLASGSDDATVKIWCAHDGRLDATLSDARTTAVYCITQLGDADVIACGTDNNICIWRIAAQQLLKMVCGHTSYVWACLFVNDALVSASADKTIRFWNVDETSYAFGESTAILTDHRDSVYALCVFPDGQRLASGSADTSILVWKPLAQKNCKIGTYTQAKCLRGHSKLVYSLVAVGPEFLASASHDWSVRIWNVATGDCLQKLDGHEEAVTCLAAFLGPHGAEAPVLFSGARDCDARIWNMLTMKCERVLSGHRDEVLCVAVLASTRKRGVLATGCEDGTINVWGIVQT
eukprot:m.251346 g.251346  ORF g.251346 m.251346 type:complete len:475 (+) comp19536_c0_seq15:127-1551(+)